MQKNARISPKTDDVTRTRESEGERNLKLVGLLTARWKQKEERKKVG